MTDSAVQVDCGDTTFVPAGRPVARFVSVLVAVAVLLVAMWITGLVAARVTVASGESQFDTRTREGSAVVDVHNVGVVPARVDRIDVTDPYISSTARAPTLPVRIPAGAHRRITVPFVVDCEKLARDQVTWEGATDPSLSFRVHVKGAVGGGRWVRVGNEQASTDYCGLRPRPQPSLPLPPTSR